MLRSQSLGVEVRFGMLGEQRLEFGVVIVGGQQFTGGLAHQLVNRLALGARPMGRVVTNPDWSCDVQDLAGLATSKSSLEDYADLDAFALGACDDLVRDASSAHLETLKAHEKGRVWNAATAAAASSPPRRPAARPLRMDVSFSASDRQPATHYR